MKQETKPDWDPRSDKVCDDQQTAYDEMRTRCPVAYSEFLRWSLFRHEDISRVLHDHETFSNAVSSRHLTVPNGMDPPEHTAYRKIIEKYFVPERMEAFEPVCRKIARMLVRDRLWNGELEFMTDLATPFAVHVQCAFLGWPSSLYTMLVNWIRKNQEATFARDRQAMSGIAQEFEDLIDEMLDSRKQKTAEPDGGITIALMNEKVWGRPLSNEEIASILRNWTVGEIGTISASVGILANYLARHPDLQNQLREQPALLPAAIDEILRIQGPLIANRRITNRPVEIGFRKIEAGEIITLMWTAANRDGCAFDNPDAVDLNRDPQESLLYGAGVHVCPGAPLARMELRIIMEELLAQTTAILPASGKPASNAVYPAAGFSILPLWVNVADI